MPRYIDADALVAELQKKPIHDGHFIHTRDVSDAIFYAPTVSPDEVRGVGEWIGEGDGYADGFMVYDMWSCSCCGEYFDEWDDRPKWKFCPSCGARMKGADE